MATRNLTKLTSLLFEEIYIDEIQKTNTERSSSSKSTTIEKRKQPFTGQEVYCGKNQKENYLGT